MFKFFTPLCFSLSLFGCQAVSPAQQNPQPMPQPIKKPEMMCTMQYDPVCVKTINNGLVRYQTYGNACMASNSVNAMDKTMSVTKGACESEASK
ncbi:hypothetical protein A9299_03985 [Moraxella osloensis]|uniref:Kazal-like domain-containing protein n=1 Tax=Faucicola osloensis TaxID=34062 RepID=A0AA91FNI7_FAUOS|nr:hypothetical protein [Moraxella osloensis]OBX62367.1 hypothetical protein A9299_03985 [Moraxella osloensis]